MEDVKMDLREDSPFKTDFVMTDLTATLFWHYLKQFGDAFCIISRCKTIEHVREHVANNLLGVEFAKEMLLNAYAHSMEAPLRRQMEAIKNAALEGEP